MPSAAEARSFNASYKASTASSSASRPVAVVVGGTSGVGAATVTSLTSVFNGDIDVYVIGRNQARGQAVLDGLALPSASASSASSQDESKLGKPVRDFIPCDVWLMRDVARATNELKTTKGVEKINYLVLTPGMMTMQGRTESDEGIDQKMAVHYYGRWKFAYDLVPLLQRAKDAGEDAKLLTVLSAGVHEGPINTSDLGLKQTYSMSATAHQAPSYNDALIQSFAQRHPALSFVHAFPGITKTNLNSSSNSAILRVLGRVSHALAQSAEDCGERMTWGLLNAHEGWMRINEKGEDIGTKGLYTSEEVNRALWKHTVKETRSEEAAT